MRVNFYSITLNPALDLSGHVDDIIQNEKNTVHQSRMDPGGNAINAARIARRLGARPVLLGYLGGAAGTQIARLLRKEGLTLRFTSIADTTRTNITVTNDRTHQQTRLTFPGPRIRLAEARALAHQFNLLPAPGIAVIGGSLPQGLPARAYEKWVRAAQKKGLGVVIDVPASELAHLLDSPSREKFLFLKPNQAELEAWAKRRLSTVDEIARVANELLTHSAIVCVSRGKHGAVVAWGGQCWQLFAPKIRARGTVGAGDSMVGAVVAAFCRNGWSRPEHIEEASERAILDALSWGAAAGAATAATEGTSLGGAGLIRRLYSRTRVQAIPVNPKKRPGKPPRRKAQR